MGSIDTRSQNKDVEAIKEALTTGALTPAEMDRRLHAILEYETSKLAEEIDVNMVSACNNLLWELHAREATQIPNHTDEQRVKLQAYLAKTKPKAKRTISVYRIAGIAVALLVLVVFGEAMLRHQWLQGKQADDEQQLILQGKVIDPGLVEQGNASGLSGVLEIVTKSMEEVVTFLGFQPPCPQWIPEEWKLRDYVCVRTSNASGFYATYCLDGESKVLSFIFDRYLDAEHVRDEIEQNERGDVTKLANGRSIYITDNMDSSVCVWVEGLDAIMLTGPVEKNILLLMAESIN